MISRKQFAEENRRIKALQKQGRTADYIKSWLRGWRSIGEKR